MNDIVIYSLSLMAVVFAGSATIHIWGSRLIKHLGLLLAFGGAYLIGLVFLHLVPEVFYAQIEGAAQLHDHAHHGHDHAAYSGYINAGWFILLGFVLQIFLEYFSNGIEHGHQHKHDHHHHDHDHDDHHEEILTSDVKRFRAFPLAAFISLCIHAFVEAMPLAGGAHHHHHHGGLNIAIESTSLLVGLLIHTFPVAMVLAGLLLATSLSKLKQWMFITIFAIMPVFGMVLSDYLLKLPGIDSNYLLMALGGVLIGILLHIATTMLFETSDGHHFNLRKLLIIVVGLVIAALTLA